MKYVYYYKYNLKNLNTLKLWNVMKKKGVQLSDIIEEINSDNPDHNTFEYSIQKEIVNWHYNEEMQKIRNRISFIKFLKGT